MIQNHKLHQEVKLLLKYKFIVFDHHLKFLEQVNDNNIIIKLIIIKSCAFPTLAASATSVSVAQVFDYHTISNTLIENKTGLCGMVQ